MKKPLYLLLLFQLLACGQQRSTDKAKILIFCAASLTSVVSEIADEFETKHAISVQLNFASSGTLARQIEHGANPSLFLCASKNWVTYLNHIGKTDPDYERKLAGNSLVVIAPGNSPISPFAFETPQDFAEQFKGRLSIGDPRHVPAGEYAMQAIERMGCKDELAKRLLPAKDVRSALMVVELAETAAGIVYKTDALQSGKVKIIAEIPPHFHTPITCYLSVIKGHNNKNTQRFYDFLSAEPTKSTWIKHGFNLNQ